MLLAVTRRLPKVRGSGRIGHAIANFYRRKPRAAVMTSVFGFRMRLDPMEYVEADILFVPQIYDRRELNHLRRVLRPGDVFVDLGANVGLYALVASRLVGATGRVYAVDADLYSIERLTEHVALNGLSNVVAIHAGVSDREEIRRLGINQRGNRGASSFSADGEVNVDVRCHSLAQLIRPYGVTSFSAAKLDIEGFGYRVLDNVLREADSSAHPRLLIVEKEPGVERLMQEYGYRHIDESGLNYVFERAGPTTHARAR